MTILQNQGQSCNRNYPGPDNPVKNWRNKSELKGIQLGRRGSLLGLAYSIAAPHAWQKGLGRRTRPVHIAAQKHQIRTSQAKRQGLLYIYPVETNPTQNRDTRPSTLESTHRWSNGSGICRKAIQQAKRAHTRSPARIRSPENTGPMQGGIGVTRPTRHIVCCGPPVFIVHDALQCRDPQRKDASLLEFFRAASACTSLRQTEQRARVERLRLEYSRHSR